MDRRDARASFLRLCGQARELFESEVNRIGEEGQKLISELWKGNVEGYINSKREALVNDINGMFLQLGRTNKVTDEVIDRVVENLKARFKRAQSTSFMPKLTYSTISFVHTDKDNAYASPWGQAYSLLADIAGFSRKALTDSFFLRGLKVSDESLLEVMNVANDALLRNQQSRGIRIAAKRSLTFCPESRRLPWNRGTGVSLLNASSTLVKSRPSTQKFGRRRVLEAVALPPYARKCT